MPEKMRVEVTPDQEVTALIYPAASLLGHGAGAHQRSGFMTRFASELAARGMSVVTFNFLYTEQDRRVPDANGRLEACFRAVIEAVRKKKIGRNKPVTGGKSMGGRIASQVAATGCTADGIAFLGYPLHPPGKLDQLRSRHLPNIKAPILCIQGSRDSFGTPEELRPILETLKPPTELYAVEGGDRSFKVLKSVGITQDYADKAVPGKIEAWLRQNFI